MKKLFSIILIIILITPFSLGEKKESLTFAGDFNLPPIEYLDSQGNPKGFAVDIVNELSKKINKTIEIKLVPWEKAVELLNTGKVDGIEFMRITEERKKRYDFVPYLESFSVIIVPIGSPINNFMDLKKKKVGVFNLDVAHIFLKDITQTIPYESSKDVLLGILRKDVDAGVINYYAAKWLITQNNWNDKLKILPDKLFTNYSGIALPKGSPYFLTIKKAIDEIIKSPKYIDLLQKWFGEEILLRLEIKKKESQTQGLLILFSLLAFVFLWILGSRRYLKKEVERQTKEIRTLLEENKRKYEELIIGYEFLRDISNKNIEDVERIFYEKLKDLFPENDIKILKRLNNEFLTLYPKQDSLKIKIEDLEKSTPNNVYTIIENKIQYAICYEKEIPQGIFDLLLEEFKHTVEDINLKKRLKKEKEISEIIDLFSEKIEKNLFLESILRRTLNILDADAGSIMAYDEDENTLKIFASCGIPKEVVENTVLRMGEGIAGWVAQHREPLILEDAYKDSRFLIIEPRFNIKSSICYPLIHNDKLVGVLNINSLRESKKFDQRDLEIVEKISPVLSSLLYKEDLENRIYRLNRESLIVLVEMIDARDPYTGGHSREVRNIAVNFGKYIGLNDEELRILEYAGHLHDIGKIKVPDYILKKPGKLSDEEYMIMKMHPVWGEEILQNVSAFREIGKLIRHHHERWDGKGYPDGISGEDIPFYSRILTLADSFQAMTAYRPYKKRLTIDEAIEEIKRCKGSQFDPYLSDYFIEMILMSKVRFS
ncbi:MULTISPECIES: HD domain-containing phosphohydrolase [Dictyoglomus]|uniref:Metal dependent phosphohydrolase n=1 Tax=Dictyoglomus turgidum (strain DSM 6724 / Z-1310) TaxID=515635 RepID=B8E1N0_DICTD|nr:MULTISPECIES: HD domain-containing phosphohydrolase [Dictyoglomus]ACK41555.1 metal dependent phosphohydrolase [Dictyoglomus turgidum DSM 6724]HBU31729.1 HD domain-containing protein [Dictyoglomus sp.]